jgi:hypothetical protein
MPHELTRPAAPHTIEADATGRETAAVTQVRQHTEAVLAELPRRN